MKFDFFYHSLTISRLLSLSFLFSLSSSVRLLHLLRAARSTRSGSSSGSRGRRRGDDGGRGRSCHCCCWCCYRGITTPAVVVDCRAARDGAHDHRRRCSGPSRGRSGPPGCRRRVQPEPEHARNVPRRGVRRRRPRAWVGQEQKVGTRRPEVRAVEGGVGAGARDEDVLAARAPVL